MSINVMPTLDHIEIPKTECVLNIEHRHSFLKPDESSSGGSNNIKVEDQGSSSSEFPFAASTRRPMSTTGSSAGDEIMRLTDPTELPNKAYVHQLPQSFVQAAGSQVYRPVIYDQQNARGYNFTPVTIGMPSLGYGPVTVQPMPMNIPLPPPQIVYPMQQCQQITQNWAHIPLSATAVPCMMGPLTFPQQNNPETQHASIVSSTVSTPVISCFSSPGLVNTYEYINAPLISSASCPPIPYPIAYPDVPPAFDLIKSKTEGCMYPSRISCNINLGQETSVSETPASVAATTANSQPDKPARSVNSLFHEPVTEIEKRKAKRVEENLWRGNLDYEEYQLNGGSNLFIE